MEMQMEFIRKLPTPEELKQEFPTDAHVKAIKEERDAVLEHIFKEKEDRELSRDERELKNEWEEMRKKEFD